MSRAVPAIRIARQIEVPFRFGSVFSEGGLDKESYVAARELLCSGVENETSGTERLETDGSKNWDAPVK
ncbi:hypothetical protein E6P09_16075 (plasmid) [Haloferax mediterranei ATCC 33500]|uniref:Uncharacterized protein n=1 Tax=Haloferax mediterranei (strain ATCC 33500 / DSM 1411 / JCM 8866 / NBRC 14739 / NCIMB 2177 / R-4) TaxID=523841 RepID=I3RB85_HALMT|nr:hypothetical protein HFX_6375 [Haloferax mediterranei ATCC 33500]AHZ24447.1 hypothetical protein BM92_16155 [Haloferax mediterranei ATCC 33500]ELZ97193.1 hypothetical protein C439_17763 [Haloferax mediterranei ATCC 33500]QCQ76845.1 hypothetical protein E6P09_16075 [Haloferax mediterranei ATCC 33500]